MAVSGTTSVDLHAAALPTGQVTVNLTGFTSGGLVPYDALSPSMAPSFSVSNGSVVVFSAMDYDIGIELEKQQGNT